jgi:hypothetical protein
MYENNKLWHAGSQVNHQFTICTLQATEAGVEFISQIHEKWIITI